MTLIDDARVLLEALARSPYADLHVRTAGGEIFVAKPHGRPNPLRAVVDDRPRITITAPHVATVVSVVSVGSRVAAGSVVAKLAVLDETLDVLAEEGGVVVEALAGQGDLVDFEAPLVRLSGPGTRSREAP